MFLPIGDYPNPRTVPWVTRILIGLNVAVYLFVNVGMNRPLTEADRADTKTRALIDQNWRAIEQAQLEAVEKGRARGMISREQFEAQLTHDALFSFEHGYKPAAPTLLSLFFCMFLHGGFMHLFGNMLFLWIFGDNVEARMGRFGYLAGYLVTGVVATLTFALPNADSLIPLVGASGALSGVLGFYLVWFPHNKVKVFVWLFYFIDVWHISAVWVLLVKVFLLDNILPILAGAEGGVAYLAHIGGFGGGVLGAFLINVIFGKHPSPHPQVERHHRYRRGEPIPVRKVEDPSRAFHAALSAGNMEDAAYAFARIAREGGSPPQPPDVFTLAEWLYSNDFARDAVAVFRYYISNYPRGEDRDRVHLGLGVLLAHRMGRKAAAREHLLAAIDLARDHSIATNARYEMKRLNLQ